MRVGSEEIWISKPRSSVEHEKNELVDHHVQRKKKKIVELTRIHRARKRRKGGDRCNVNSNITTPR